MSTRRIGRIVLAAICAALWWTVINQTEKSINPNGFDLEVVNQLQELTEREEARKETK